MTDDKFKIAPNCTRVPEEFLTLEEVLERLECPVEMRVHTTPCTNVPFEDLLPDYYKKVEDPLKSFTGLYMRIPEISEASGVKEKLLVYLARCVRRICKFHTMTVEVKDGS